MNWQGMHTAALIRMAYHYGHPGNDPDLEAEHYLSNLPLPLEPTDLLVLDLETSDGKGQAEVNAWAKEWAAHVTESSGQRPILYCGHAYQENRTGIGLNGPYGAWWYPRYPNAYANQAVWPAAFTPTLPSPNAWGGPPDLWQFSSTFPSGQGTLDANLFDGSLAELAAYNQGG